ncbi:hypothetical protein PCASD_05644 [Puccinia coronata f. sp. avenae]|uniref:Uncharacterized protein n=1 Tax=Puccinia coronata f. sp. avenae TaxID=200324 RepID=A0A2N5UVD7_9BASI|nr:hypothetical protein PCASD_05644 [Puccinia coronata f. sp. avenae]
MLSTGWFTRLPVETGDSWSPDILSSCRLGDLTVPRQTPAYLPAQPRPLDLAGRLPSDVCLLPGPVGVCPANLGPHRQATGGSHGLLATIQPTWDHPVRPPGALPSSHRLPYHP